ncbi:MAG TPA: hypothetical protein VMS08_02670 [Candidatus Saccharimonadia bacterium]|nr:hypothetical protein [Candidatus Saccharimonadia bacterium]
MPVDKGDVSLLFELLHKVSGESLPAALCLASFLAEHMGKYTGHAMHHRTQLLTLSHPSQAAMASARQYDNLAPQMPSLGAEPSARLGIVELQFLRYFHGERISWRTVTDTLNVLATQFRQIPDAGDREGSAHAMLAFAYLQQAQRQPHSETGEKHAQILFARADASFQRAITMLGMAYELPDIVDIVRPVSPEIVEEILGTQHEGQRVPASA